MDENEVVQTTNHGPQEILRVHSKPRKHKPGYSVGYRQKGPLEQVNILQLHYPGIKSYTLPPPAKFPPNVSYFACPKWRIVADLYEEAVEVALSIMQEVHGDKFMVFNRREEQISSCLRRVPKTASMLHKLCEKQEGDVIFLPAQFGIRHRGCSANEAQKRFAKNEFGLGAFEGLNMLLTHQERLTSDDALSLNFPGDEFDNATSSLRFSYTPFACYRDDKLRFGMQKKDQSECERYGSLSGFYTKD